MAPRPGPARPPRRRGVLRHYDRPLVRDRLFWLVAVPSLLATATALGLLVVVWGVPGSWWGWTRNAVVALLVLNLAFRMLGLGVTARRHYERGLGDGSRSSSGDLEAKGRAAGAVVGRALRARRSSARSTVHPATPSRPLDRPVAATVAAPASARATAGPPPTATEPSPVTPTPERAARVVGTMVGRRLADRRRRR